jgi:hypothetical protein
MADGGSVKTDVKPRREETENRFKTKPSSPRAAQRVEPGHVSDRHAARGYLPHATLGAFLRGLVSAVALTIDVFAVKLL